MLDLSEHKIWPEHASLGAGTLCAYVQRPTSQPNLVKSEQSKYLWNQENIPDLSEHIIWPKHASLCACTLCACVLGPISQPNWVWSERSKYLWNQENMLDLSEHIIWPKHASLCAFKLCACLQGAISQPSWVGSERLKYLWNKGTCWTSQGTKFDPSTQACIHAHYVLAWLGPFLSQNGLEEKDEGIYRIGRTYGTYLST